MPTYRLRAQVKWKTASPAEDQGPLPELALPSRHCPEGGRQELAREDVLTASLQALQIHGCACSLPPEPTPQPPAGLRELRSIVCDLPCVALSPSLLCPADPGTCLAGTSPAPGGCALPVVLLRLRCEAPPCGGDGDPPTNSAEAGKAPHRAPGHSLPPRANPTKPSHTPKAKDYLALTLSEKDKANS